MAETDNRVQLTDLDVIARYSLAVRAATADRNELIAALRSDLEWLQGSRSRRTTAPAPDVPVAPAPVAPAAPAAVSRDRRAPAAKKATAKKAATKKAAPARRATATKNRVVRKSAAKKTTGRR